MEPYSCLSSKQGNLNHCTVEILMKFVNMQANFNTTGTYLLHRLITRQIQKFEVVCLADFLSWFMITIESYHTRNIQLCTQR
jgi:hypothetical protein